MYKRFSDFIEVKYMAFKYGIFNGILFLILNLFIYYNFLHLLIKLTGYAYFAL